jgi:hypothetical protein
MGCGEQFHIYSIKLNKHMQFDKFFQLINEAIPLKYVKKKKLTREHSPAYKSSKLNELFGDKDRLVFPLKLDESEVIDRNDNPLIRRIFDILHANFQVTIRTRQDYILGIAFKPLDNQRKQPYRIGKLLNKLAPTNTDAKNLADAFRDDPMRASKKSQDFYVVISRHPYDLAGMSTDRNWTSCMNLGIKNVQYKEKSNNAGINKHFVARDIDAGSLIAYLVSGEDIHANGKMAIQKPLARILLKPHVNTSNKNDVVYSLGRMYGASVSSFKQFVSSWLKEKTNNDTKNKSYSVVKGLYNDSDEAVNFKKVENSSDVFRIALENELGYSNTDEKYWQFIETNMGNGWYGGRQFELSISFRFKSSVTIPQFRFSQNSTKPAFLQEMLKTVPINAYLHNIESFPDTNSLVLEYQYTDQFYEAPKHQDEDSQIEEFEYILKSIGIRKLNYEKSFKAMDEILDSFSLENTKKTEEETAKKLFRDNIENNKSEIQTQLKSYFSQWNAVKLAYHKIINLSDGENSLCKLYEYFSSEQGTEDQNLILTFEETQKKVAALLWPKYNSDNFHFSHPRKYFTEEQQKILQTARFDREIKPLQNLVRPFRIMRKDGEEHQKNVENLKATYGEKAWGTLIDYLADLS